jgi:hypothetical protein
MDLAGNVSEKRRVRFVQANNLDSRAYFKVRLHELAHCFRRAAFGRGKAGNNVKNAQVWQCPGRSIG